MIHCYACVERFNHFRDLAEHLSLEHDSDRDCAHAIEVAIFCARLFEGETDMALPQPTRRAPREERAPRSERREILKAHHIGRVGTRATIQLAGNVRMVEGTYGEQIAVDCQHNGTPFVFMVNMDSPNYENMVERFTTEESKWFGPVDVAVKQGITAAYLIVPDDQGATPDPKPTARRARK